jgi:hypothetical protein
MVEPDARFVGKWQLVKPEVDMGANPKQTRKENRCLFQMCRQILKVATRFGTGVHNKSLDASGGSVFRKIIDPAMLE